MVETTAVETMVLEISVEEMEAEVSTVIATRNVEIRVAGVVAVVVLGTDGPLGAAGINKLTEVEAEVTAAGVVIKVVGNGNTAVEVVSMDTAAADIAAAAVKDRAGGIITASIHRIRIGVTM